MAASKGLKVAASLIVYDVPRMTRAGRKRIAKWLRSRADWLEKHEDLAAKNWRARYYYSSSDIV